MIRDQLPLLVLGQLATGEVQRTGQRPLIFLLNPGLDNLGALIAKFVGNPLAVVAVDDPTHRPIGIDEDGNQDAVDRDVVTEGGELVGRKWRQCEDGFVAGFLGCPGLPGFPLGFGSRHRGLLCCCQGL